MKRLVTAAVVVAALLASFPTFAMGAGAGTEVSLRGSPFGQMLWAPKRQALYMFDRDGDDRSRCYGACAKAWPPLLTRGEPSVGNGLDPDLIGTTRRRNGDRQVTYNGRPLYTYAHEGRGQVLCHDIFLNGGWWYAVGADGERLP